MLPTFLLLNRMATERRNLREERDAIKSLKNDQNALDVEYCRTCLNTQDLEVIFYDEESEEKRSEELRLATGLEIKLNDGLSQKICNSCIDSLETSLQFRHASRKAEKALLKMLCNDSSKKCKSKISNSVKKSRTKRERVDSMELRTKTEEEDTGYDDGYIYEDRYETEVDKIFDEDVPDIKLEQAETGPGRKKRQPIPNAASYKCNTCGKEFRMKATYKAHMRFHTSYCVCESCGKRCRNNNQLQEHKRARHGLGRIHKCAYCEYSSATKEALTIHERRHTGERPYVCDHCGATFHRRSNLVQHIAIHLPEKNFQCDMCPKRLKSRKFLQIHKHNAHTGKRYGYLCSICEHRFEKPNKCAICSKREKSRKLLQVHEYKRHRENRYRYVCPVCRESFARPGNVRLHLARAHAVPRDAQGRIEKYEINLPPVPQINIEGRLQ